MTVTERVAYLKGLFEGLEIDTEKKAVSYTHLDVYKRQQGISLQSLSIENEILYINLD